MLEERAVTPVGSLKRRPIDVRVVAATNHRLEQLVQQHQFRADLFYRLNVARIDLPPLRARPEDIGPIVDHFIAEQNQRHRLQVGRIDAPLLAQMRRYAWPGNVRELRNLVEALFIDPPEGRTVRLDDLPPAFRALFRDTRSAGQPERDKLIEVLRETNWNKVEAARAMNWSRMTLYRKLAKYALDPTQDADENDVTL